MYWIYRANQWLYDTIYVHLLVYCLFQFCWAHIEYVLVNFADQIEKIEKFFRFHWELHIFLLMWIVPSSNVPSSVNCTLSYSPINGSFLLLSFFYRFFGPPNQIEKYSKSSAKSAASVSVRKKNSNNKNLRGKTQNQIGLNKVSIIFCMCSLYAVDALLCDSWVCFVYKIVYGEEKSQCIGVTK